MIRHDAKKKQKHLSAFFLSFFFVSLVLLWWWCVVLHTLKYSTCTVPYRTNQRAIQYVPQTVPQTVPTYFLVHSSEKQSKRPVGELIG